VEEGDGNEVWDVYRKASQAVSRARRGDGPQFLEFDTYRWREHCGPNYDNDIGYRSEEEFHDWKERCPLGRCETMLSSEPDFDSRRREASEAIAKEIEAAFEYAETSPFPDAAEVDEEGWE